MTDSRFCFTYYKTDTYYFASTFLKKEIQHINKNKSLLKHTKLKHNEIKYVCTVHPRIFTICILNVSFYKDKL